MSASAELWYNRKEIFDAVRKFHDDCANKFNADRARQQLHEILTIFQQELGKEDRSQVVVQRFERVGSAYDGSKISDGQEFDIQVILRGGEKLTTEGVKAGYCRLKPLNRVDCSLSAITDSVGFLSAQQTMNQFTSRLRKTANSTPELLRYGIKLVYHGPAIQIDFFDDPPACKSKLFSVDMVPTFEVEGILYVPKPLFEIDSGKEVSNVWRNSYSIEEKKKFNGIDSGNGCRKHVLRVCKAIRLDRSELRIISSYLLKNALFFEVDALPNDEDWKHENLASRVIEIWMRMASYFDKGVLPCYFNPDMNLIDQMPEKTRVNLKDRITGFCSNQDRFLKLLGKIRAECSVKSLL